MEQGLSFAPWTKREMTFYQDRLQSFKDWPKQIIPDKFSLAKAGFYYTGQQDNVQCFACDVKITGWGRIDDPWLVHKKRSGKYHYLKITGCGDEASCSHSNMEIITNSFQTTGFTPQNGVHFDIHMYSKSDLSTFFNMKE